MRLGKMRHHLSIGFLVSLLAGCEAGPVAVEGKVTLDGQPLDSGTITFLPDPGGKSPAAAAIAGDGSFRLSVANRKNKTGAMPGTYKVTVSKTKMVGGQSVELLPTQYADHNKTTLKIDVPPEGNRNLVIPLVTAAKPQ